MEINRVSDRLANEMDKTDLNLVNGVTSNQNLGMKIDAVDSVFNARMAKIIFRMIILVFNEGVLDDQIFWTVEKETDQRVVNTVGVYSNHLIVISLIDIVYQKSGVEVNDEMVAIVVMVLVILDNKIINSVIKMEIMDVVEKDFILFLIVNAVVNYTI